MDSHKLAFVAYYTKNNRYSFNAVIGALECHEIGNQTDIYYVANKMELVTKLKELIIKYQKVVLGISFFTTQVWKIYELVQLLRTNFAEELIIIAGGPHPTGEPRRTLKMGFDVVIIGEGEESLPEVLEKIEENGEYGEVKGIAYFTDQGEYISTGKRERIDLNKYPPFPLQNQRFGPIEITRGCPYVCYFCQTSFILGTRPRHRSIESICKYVRLMKRENLTDIRFVTPNAFSYGSPDGKTLDLSKLETLLKSIKEIISPNGRIFLGSFPSEVRPEHVTEETISLIKNYASNDNIIIGAQSGSQKILDLCHRGHTVEDVYSAVEITIKNGLKANVDFIFGLPHETDKDIQSTIKMMKDLVKMGARIHTHSFIPLPQTPFSTNKVKKISTKIKKTVSSFTATGQAFGEFEKQEKLAKKIYKYLKNGKIK